MEKFHFSGWATRNDLLCGDGRTIRKNAFKDNDGKTVPLVWNHEHGDPKAVLGHAVLENREDGVYAYCTFNDEEQGKNAKALVEHGDVRSLSIWANQLKHMGKDVIHGNIRELSLVLAGANPGAFIDYIMAHSDEEGDSMIVNYDENALVICHSDEPKKETDKEEPTVADETKKDNKSENEKTVKEVVDSMTEEQRTVLYALVGAACESADEKDDSEGGENNMKHNVFDNETAQRNDVLSHSDQAQIIALAKSAGVGSLQDALSIFAEDNADTLAHGIDEVETLFSDYKDVHPGAPELLERDLGWVSTVMKKTHKSPISRIRTRQADARAAELRALGYKKGNQKTNMGNIKLLSRTTDPQTIFIKDSMHRDDILDIQDFDVIAYEYRLMTNLLHERVATAIMIGDGLEDGDENKIEETHVRSIWNDDELYTIHAEVDIEAAKTELQGTNTNANFGDNYIYAEAIITAALYSREQYKGSGSLEFYCTPHLLNVMLLARDLNGHRIYSSKADLAAALNVTAIHTVEQFEGKTRTTADGATKKLLGIFVNLADYQVGSVKGGEITRFQQFDIDFNQEKFLIETRVSGALTKIKSAIVLEEPVATAG